MVEWMKWISAADTLINLHLYNCMWRIQHFLHPSHYYFLCSGWFRQIILAKFNTARNEACSWVNIFKRLFCICTTGLYTCTRFFRCLYLFTFLTYSFICICWYCRFHGSYLEQYVTISYLGRIKIHKGIILLR